MAPADISDEANSDSISDFKGSPLTRSSCIISDEAKISVSVSDPASNSPSSLPPTAPSKAAADSTGKAESTGKASAAMAVSHDLSFSSLATQSDALA